MPPIPPSAPRSAPAGATLCSHGGAPAASVPPGASARVLAQGRPGHRSRRTSPGACLVGVALLLASTGCAAETVVHGVDEREANQIIEILADADIGATKITGSTGRAVAYDISVPASRRTDAIKVLNEREMPRRRSRGYADVFAGGGLIPTSSEEKAKRLAALEGEIERQLRLVDGILDVEVQVVAPEDGVLRALQEEAPPTTASVTMKYLPRADGSRPATEAEVQAVVAAGVEKLTPDHVVVLMRKVEQAPVRRRPPVRGLARGAAVGRAVVAGVGASLVLLLAGIVFSQWQLRAARRRLVRLQGEIARGRKKPVESLSAAAAGQSS